MIKGTMERIRVDVSVCWGNNSRDLDILPHAAAENSAADSHLLDRTEREAERGRALGYELSEVPRWIPDSETVLARDFADILSLAKQVDGSEHHDQARRNVEYETEGRASTIAGVESTLKEGGPVNTKEQETAAFSSLDASPPDSSEDLHGSQEIIEPPATVPSPLSSGMNREPHPEVPKSEAREVLEWLEQLFENCDWRYVIDICEKVTFGDVGSGPRARYLSRKAVQRLYESDCAMEQRNLITEELDDNMPHNSNAIEKAIVSCIQLSDETEAARYDEIRGMRARLLQPFGLEYSESISDMVVIKGSTDDFMRAFKSSLEEGNAALSDILILDNAIAYRQESGKASRTPLYYAIKHNSVKYTSRLLLRGVELDEDVTNGESPMSIAGHFGSVEVGHYLLKSGANPDGNPSTRLIRPLQRAVLDSDRETIRRLLFYGADPNLPDNRSERLPLHTAIVDADHAVTSILLASGANPNLGSGHQNDTALHIAARIGHHGITVLLCSQGGSINARNIHGQSPLYIASMEGHGTIVQDLLRAGAYVNVRCADDEKPIHAAVFNGHIPVVVELLNGGADINARNRFLQTPLHAAARAGDHNMVRLLCSYDADLTIRDKWGHTAFGRYRNLTEYLNTYKERKHRNTSL